jgi:hypothetical protein
MSEQPQLPEVTNSSLENDSLVLASSVDTSIVKNTLITVKELADLRATNNIDLLQLAKLANPILDTESLVKQAEKQAEIETNFKGDGSYIGIGIGSSLGLAILGATIFYPNGQNSTLGFFGGAMTGTGAAVIGARKNQEKFAKRAFELTQNKAMAELLALESKRLNGNTPTIESQIHKIRNKETLE